ncbi:MAG: glycosyltransferase family 2 protein [Candidatus Peribacteraceae bacterium]|nr:glycosyltransferase family 2 protein [Candidatus Peribacteraceae bacterium]
MNTPLVSVLILNYRTPQVAVTCVQQLQKQSTIDQIEIIVIDNHSLDDSIGVLRNQLSEYANVRVIETPNNDGFGYGYNTGAKYAHGEYLLFNNPAKRLPIDGVEKLVNKMESDESIGILAPKLMHGDGTQRSSARAFPNAFDVVIKRSFLKHIFPNRYNRYLQLDFDSNLERDVEWVIGGSFIIRRDLFEIVGRFDERFFLFFEDTDLCQKVQREGKRIVYFPEVVASDRKRRLSDMPLFRLPFNQIGRAHMKSAVQYFWKWKGLRL